MTKHDCDAYCWCPPKTYLFGLVQVYPDRMWSIWCPNWIQPLILRVLRRIG